MEAIHKKIVGYSIKSNTIIEVTDTIDKQKMNEDVKRPELLYGSTYKVVIPTYEHAMYITINDYILNEGTEHEQKHPYEIFINCKNMDHFQWVLAITRVISAIFRKGGDYLFLIEELNSIFDPRGGHFKGKKYVPSLVAEIGSVIHKHLISNGVIVEEDVTTYNKISKDASDNAVLCKQCNHKSLVMMDGCMTCFNCGDSKCG